MSKKINFKIGDLLVLKNYGIYVHLVLGMYKEYIRVQITHIHPITDPSHYEYFLDPDELKKSIKNKIIKHYKIK